MAPNPPSDRGSMSPKNTTSNATVALISLYLISNVLCSGGGGDDTRFESHFGGLFIDPVTRKQVVEGLAVAPGDRSEGHTVELQSIRSISYAVFCLKRKT